MKKVLVVLLAMVMVVALAACGKDAKDSKPDYSAFLGQYSDEVSGRATAEVTESEDGNSILIKVNWGSGANDMVAWTMSATFDGEKLNYTDCKCIEMIFNEDGTETDKELFANGSGYFQWEDGKMSWTGSPEESCKECVFVRE